MQMFKYFLIIQITRGRFMHDEKVVKPMAAKMKLTVKLDVFILALT